MVEIAEFVAKMTHGNPLVILDVREPEEFVDWSIPGAINIPLADVTSRVGEIPEGELVVVCARGARATQAAGILRDLGLDPDVLDQGMAAWGVSRSFNYNDAVKVAWRTLLVPATSAW